MKLSVTFFKVVKHCGLYRQKPMFGRNLQSSCTAPHVVITQDNNIDSFYMSVNSYWHVKIYRGYSLTVSY